MKRYISVLSVFMIGMAALWLLAFPSVFPSIQNPLDYSADILAVDNFYNASTQSFSGPELSIAEYYYKQQEGGEVEVVFDVRTVDGTPIFSVEETVQINRWSGQVINGREGYVFGPQSRSAESYDYWRLNSDETILMEFIAEEELGGVDVRHYRSEFTANQSEGYSYLPSVPEQYDMFADVWVDLWIEPYTGYLVKYEDGAEVYFVDQASGATVEPYNSFWNQYQHRSLVEHMRTAKVRLLMYKLLYLPVAAIFALIALWLIFSHYPKGRRLIGASTLVLVVVAIGFIVWQLVFLRSTSVDDHLPHVGVTSWVIDDVLDENYEGFLEGLQRHGFIEGKTVNITRVIGEGTTDSQEQIAIEFSQQQYDVLFTQTTVSTQIMKSIEQETPIVFSVVTHPVEAGLIASSQGSGNNLVGSRHWVLAEDQLPELLELVPTIKTIGFIRHANESSSGYQYDEFVEAAGRLGIQVIDLQAQSLAGTLQLLAEYEQSLDGVYLACDSLVELNKTDILDATARYALPELGCSEGVVEAGALIGVVSDLHEIGIIAGEKAGLILKGELPSVLQTNLAHDPEILIHQDRLKTLGLTVPQSLLTDAKFLD